VGDQYHRSHGLWLLLAELAVQQSSQISMYLPR
jgi:hypothetical protein